MIKQLARIGLAAWAVAAVGPAQVILDSGPEKDLFRNREELNEERTMEYRGMSDSWRALTPVLQRSYGGVAYVDEDQLYQRQLAAIETGELFHDELRVVRQEGRRDAPPAPDGKRLPVEESDEGGSSHGWTIAIVLAMIVMLGVLIRHIRQPS